VLLDDEALRITICAILSMTIPTEPIGSIPRPLELLNAISRQGSSKPNLNPLYDEAVRETIERFEATGWPEHRIFVGVVSPIDPRIEHPEEIRDRILEAARYIPVEQLGTTDDCGFSPFCDDISTTREKAFAKIRSRVEGTALAEEIINDR
jgi:methionine synthase II (cobalamin-independent)